jgi:hypothetical protein
VLLCHTLVTSKAESRPPPVHAGCLYIDPRISYEQLGAYPRCPSLGPIPLAPSPSLSLPLMLQWLLMRMLLAPPFVLVLFVYAYL